MEVVESPESKGLYEKLARTDLISRLEYRKATAFEEGPPDQGFSVVVRILPISLHQAVGLEGDGDVQIWRIEPSCASVLVFYGLCGNAFRKIEELTTGLRTSVVILKDSRNSIVDDCVGAVLGGTEEYLNFLMTGQGKAIP